MADIKPVDVIIPLLKEESQSDTEDSENITYHNNTNISTTANICTMSKAVPNLKKEPVFKQNYDHCNKSPTDKSVKQNIKQEPPEIRKDFYIEVECTRQVKEEFTEDKEESFQKRSIMECKCQDKCSNYYPEMDPQPSSSNYPYSIRNYFSEMDPLNSSSNYSNINENYYPEMGPQQCSRNYVKKNDHADSSADDSKPKDKKSLGYTCKSCYSYFASEQNLLVHIYKNQSAPGIPFKCKKKLRPSVLYCAVCNNMYRYKQHLVRHLKVHFSCKFCSKTFTTVSEKDSHMILHIDIKCRFCETKFETSLLLQEHIRNVHGNRPYECKVCKARFTSRNNLTTHETMHSDKRPFSCHICKKAFKVNAKLKKHILTHESGTFSCDICKGTFKNIMSLRGHITHKHPDRKHKCTICEEEFDDRPTLFEHRKKHYQESRFSCEICNKKFKYKQSLIDHRVIHSGEKPHACTICSKLFTFKTNLTAHIRNVHKKKEVPIKKEVFIKTEMEDTLITK